MKEETALRGADIVARSLARLGCDRVFTLSGNHIMSIFDAAIEAKLDLVHVRHEAAAVHMADAWGRLTGKPGIAMVTGGPGHANAVGALYTALGAESPMVLLSGHAATWELGRGGFQEIRQADMAAPVSKASFTATSAATLGRDVGEAIRIATWGRPGPVHLSLPSDLLEERVESNAIVWPDARPAAVPALSDAVADATLAAIASAARPIIFAPPQLSNVSNRALMAKLEAATQAPAVILESPRGIADATLGAFSDLVRRADLIVLLGKALDFTTQWASGSSFDPAVRLISIDPEAALVERAAKEMDGRLVLGSIADVRGAAETLIRRAAVMKLRDGGWLKEARAALHNRPAAWASIASQTSGRLHPAQVFRVLRPYVERDPDTVLICDGGEFAQWGQSMLPVRRRMINGVGGSIGGSLSFACAARIAEPKAPVFCVLGDGTIGFHLSEFETAVRRKLPFVAVLGNDALWNAESQIQLREYGRDRMHGCDLTPARYDLAVAALGGHGEYVERAEDLPGAIERALASGKPACVNVMIESIAAPVIRLG
jgi:acetolactate synthase-1/2/3 large subunit